MTLYARADVMSVVVPPEHGGCGAQHSRPVYEGAPAKTWGLNCPSCERYLEKDIARDIGFIGRDGKQKEHHVGMWAHNSQRIPLTPDQIEYVDAQKSAGERLTAEKAAAEAQTSAQVIAARQEADLQAMAARETAAQAEARAAELERQVAELRRLVEMNQAAKQYREAAEWWAGDGPKAPGAGMVAGDVVPPEAAPVVARLVEEDGGKGNVLTAGRFNEAAVAAGACPGCGGPLRKPGARGPAPKVCADCRAKKGK